MATTADIRNGLCIRFNNDIYVINEFQHVKPGKGPAFVRTKIKNVKNGKVLDHTFSAGHKIEIVRVENRKHQFLYKEGDIYNFMDSNTFDQLGLNEYMVPNPDLLKEGTEVEILMQTPEEIPLTCELPAFVELQITYSEPGIKGDTATNASKPAKLETGATIQVPLFINEGEKIKVDTRTRSYVERVK